MTFQIKCSWPSQHLFFILLIYFKTWRISKSSEEVSNHHFRDISQFKNSRSVNRNESKYYKSVPRKTSISEINRISNISKSQIPHFFKQKLPGEKHANHTIVNLNPIYMNHNYSVMSHFIPRYSGMNEKPTQYKNNVHKSIINERQASNRLLSQIIKPFLFQNDMHSDLKESTVVRKVKKTPTKQKYVGSINNENTKNQQFYRSFSRNYTDFGVHKMKSNVDSTVISPGDFYKKYFLTHNTQSSQKNNTKFRYLPPQITNVKKLSKTFKISGNNIQNQKIVRMKKKTVIMEWNNGKTSSDENSESLRELFNSHQNMEYGNHEMQLDYGDRLNLNKENKKSPAGIQNTDKFSDEFHSFLNQDESSAVRNDVKFKNKNYGKSSTENNSAGSLNEKLRSFQKQSNNFNPVSNLRLQNKNLIERNDSFAVTTKYSESSHGAERNEMHFSVLKNDDLRTRKAQEHYNWGILTNLSPKISVIENSDSIISKKRGESHKSNQKNYIQLQILKGFSRNYFVQPVSGGLQQESQSHTSRLTFPLILLVFICLTTGALLLAWFYFPIAMHLNTTAETEVFESPLILHRKYEYKIPDAYEISISKERESLSGIDIYDGSQNYSKIDVQNSLQDADIIDHASVIDKLGKNTQIFGVPINLDAKQYQKDSEKLEASNSSEKMSLKADRTETGIGSPWDWIIKNVKTRPYQAFEHESNQSQCVYHRTDRFVDKNHKCIKRNEYLKERRTEKCQSRKYNHSHFEKMKMFTAEKKFSSVAVQSSLNKTNHVRMRSPSEQNHPLKEKIGSPWHRNLINVKTRSIVSVHENDADKNYTLCDLKHVSKVDYNSVLIIPSALKDQTVASTSNIQSFTETHFNDRETPSQCTVINDKTVLMNDISISSSIHSNSSVAECLVKTGLKFSNLSEQSQHGESTSSCYPNSNES